MKIFSERLEKIRQERGFSKKEMAEALQIGERAYYYYEEGQREPNYDKLVILARHLKVSTDYLLGLTDKP